MNNSKYIVHLSIIIALLCTMEVAGFTSAFPSDNKTSDTIIRGKAMFIPDNFWVQRKVTSSEDTNVSDYIWRVYSDRDDNHTYKEAAATIKYKTLGFLEEYFVIDTLNQFLRIGRPIDKRLVSIECDYIDYGWILKKNLILGIRCELSDNFRIPKKVMLVNSLESFQQYASNPEELKKIRFYNDPELKSESDRISKINEVFYIYKSSKKSYLLGKRRLIAQPEIIEQNIIGWVNKNRIVLWKNNLGVEPNWNNQAIKERIDRQTDTKVLSNLENAQKYLKTGSTDAYTEEIWAEYTISKQRNDGNKPRFPVFNQGSEGILNVGVIDNLGFLQRDEVRTIWPKDSTINLIFVIDGTFSMNPYFKKVVEALAIVVEQAKRIYGQKVLFGAVVFTDVNVGNHPLTIESPFTPDYTVIETFLNSIVSVKDAEKDSDLGEAVNYGIKKAIDIYDVKPWQSNIIILLGDCGNHTRGDHTQIRDEDIINLLYKNDYYLFAFQVKNENNFNYSNFTELTKNILSGLAWHKYEYYKRFYTTDINIFDEPVFLWNEPNKIALNKTAHLGSIYFPKVGKGLDDSIIYNEIISLIEKVVTFNQSVDDLLENAIVSAAKAENISDTSIWHTYIKQYVYQRIMDKGVTSSNIIEHCIANSQIYLNGYAPLNTNQVKNPLFNKILLLSRYELYDMIQCYNILLSANNGSGKYQQKAWVKIGNDYLNLDEKDVMASTIGKLNQHLFGFEGTGSFHKFQISELSKDSFYAESYSSHLKENYEELLRIFNNPNYLFSFISGDVDYFWVSVEMLP